MSLDPMLLQKIMGMKNEGMDSSMMDFISENSSLNPKTQMLLQMMMQSGDGKEVIDTDAVENISIDQKISALEDELEDTLDMIDVLADALGACSACFGAMDECKYCRGDGVPGWQKPDAKLFKHFVFPAVKRYRKDQPLKQSKQQLSSDELPQSKNFNQTVQVEKGEDHV